jgi:hypothetical protein
MKKILLISITAIIALFIIGFFTFMFMMKYEPTPSKNEVEEMVNTTNLVEFGDVEGSYLYTPRNYGYYNSNKIFVVEKSLGEEEQFNDQYVVIKEGDAITQDDQVLVEKMKNHGVSENQMKNIQVKSKHKILVYKNGETVIEDWVFKVTYSYQDESYLSFVSPKQDEIYKFNFFTKGYKQFLMF